jgi:hypothetical protein
VTHPIRDGADERGIPLVQTAAGSAARSGFPIKDTRQSLNAAYPLIEVLFLGVCGTIVSLGQVPPSQFAAFRQV